MQILKKLGPKCNFGNCLRDQNAIKIKLDSFAKSEIKLVKK